MTSQAFTEALRPHYDDAARYCRLLCAEWQPADAEDVFQEALLRALRHHDALKDPTRFRPWLFRIIQRSFLMARRRQFWNRFVPLDQAPDPADGPDVYRHLEHGERVCLLMDALSVLAPRERAAILLYEVAGFSIPEITEIQGDRSLSAVKSRLSRARTRLRRAIGARAPATLLRQLGGAADLEQETTRLVEEARRRGTQD